MCRGGGVRPFLPGDGSVIWAHCPACNGHGRESSEDDDGGPTP